MVWLELLVCAATIVIAGVKLSKYGDVIAVQTGLGGTWIGLILLATVTSLPELISGVSAVTLHNLPDLAVGGVLGSCLFNIVILSMLDLAAGSTPLSVRVHHSHILSAGFGIILLAFVCISKLFFKPEWSWGWIDPFSVAYLVIYAVAMRTVFQFETKRKLTEPAPEAAAPDAQKSLLKSSLLFILFSGFIVAASLALPDVANRIGEQTGLSETFVGSSLVAITTSLPEVIVSLAAARIGAFDMAVGNVLGSNLFNVAILGIEDACYTHGPLLQLASNQHIMSALVAVVTTAIAVVGITFRAEKKILAMTWDSVAIVCCYFAATYWLFASK
jgi:cation:H+ antiporter